MFREELVSKVEHISTKQIIGLLEQMMENFDT
jgi:hypothetical protein